jgi:hypothetical protein
LHVLACQPKAVRFHEINDLRLLRKPDALSTTHGRRFKSAPGSYLYTARARDQSSTGTQCNDLGCKDAVYAAQSCRLDP